MPHYPVVLARPPRHPRALPRPRLSGRLGDHAGLVLVGPSGSGKTVAALQVAESAGTRLAWCRLAPGYGSAAHLVGLACTSCGIDPPEADDALELAEVLLGLLEAEPTVLVVDDHHVGEQASCDPLLAEVLALLPVESRLVVTSQVRPAGLLGRVPPGMVGVVETEELAFTPGEAAALFEASGRTRDDAAAWQAGTGGWAAAVALAAEAGDAAAGSADLATVVEQLVLDRLSPAERAVLEALSVLPYLDAALLLALELGDPDTLPALARRTALVVETAGTWRIHDVGRQAVAARVTPEQTATWRRVAAEVLRSGDPLSAVDLLLLVDDAESAADVLAASATRIGPERATELAYRLPAPLRRRLPPALTAGRATVDLDMAGAAARERVASASSERERAEALLALGSSLAGAGELGEAAEAFEAVVRHGGAPGQLADTWLGIVRWWAGDLDGARGALARAPETVWAHWARAHVALVADDLEGAARWADVAVEVAGDESGATVAAGESLRAALALLSGDVEAAEAHALRADEAGEAAGGFDLACGAVSLGWVRAQQGHAAEAIAACERVERQVGRHDHHARLGAALIRAAVADSTEERERAERRVRDLRRAGFAPVERLGRSLLGSGGSTAGDGLRVELLEPGAVQVDGHDTCASWRSRKALEVLRLLALAGASGAARAQLIEAVWPGREPDKGRTLLRTALSEVRRVLEPDRQPGEPSRFLRASGDRLVLDAACDVTDARRWAAQGEWRSCFAALDQRSIAVDGAGDWAEGLARELERLRVDAAEHVAADPAAGDDARARALTVLVDAEPWHRQHYDALASLHRQAGDEPAARAVERRWFESDG